MKKQICGTFFSTTKRVTPPFFPALLGVLLLLATAGLAGAVPDSQVKSAVSPASGVPAGKTQHLTSPDQVPDGLTKSQWQGIRAAYEAGQHEFQPVADGWQARNPGQQWTTLFDRHGFLSRPRDGAWTWGLELQSYGFGEQQQTLGGQALSLIHI